MADKRRLYRLPEKGKVFGVIAGVAEYFDFDVTLLRVVFVLLVIVGAGIVIPAYIVLALILPTPTDSHATSTSVADTVRSNVDAISYSLKEGEEGVRARNYLGFGLVLVGLWLLAVRVAPELYTVRWDLIWPALLVAVGILVLAKQGRH